MHVGGPVARLRALMRAACRRRADGAVPELRRERWPLLVTMAYYNGLVVVPEGSDRGKFDNCRRSSRRRVDLINADPRKYAPC